MSTNEKATLATPNIAAQVFISYAREDGEEWAIWLQGKLLKSGVEKVWLDRSDIEAGDDWKKEIDEGLLRSTVLVAVLTKSSVQQRRWIEYEQGEAARLFKVIIPVRFDGEPPERLKRLHYIDFMVDDKDAAFSALLNTIRNRISGTSTRLLAAPRSAGDAFVGREAELQELVDVINRPTDHAATAQRRIAIQAMGGQGKTMLADELVRRIWVHYHGGLILAVRGQSPPPAEDVLQDWATLALGKKPPRVYGQADVRQLLAGHGELLVLIDDVSESDFESTNILLEALPPEALGLLTTRSRDVASVLGCIVYQLLRLNDDDAMALVRGRLEAMSATATPDNSTKQDEAIRRLVDLVHGHALALELAVARCNSPAHLPDVVNRLASSLAKGVHEFAVGLTDGVTKDHSLAVSLQISFDQLREYDRKQRPHWAKRLMEWLLCALRIKEEPSPQMGWAESFVALGVFPDNGRMNRGLLAAVWGDLGDHNDRTTNALDGLFRRAMIKLESNDIYHNHPLLSAFARSLLSREPDLLAQTQRRYLDFLTLTARQAFSEPEEQWSGMELLMPHLLHTAARLWNECTSLLGDLNALAQPEPPEADVLPADSEVHELASRAVAFAHAVMPYVLRRPALGEDGLRVLILGLACVRASGNQELMDTFVRALGVWYARGKTAMAERYFEQALRWAERTDDAAEQGKVLSDYGELQRNRAKLEEAIELLRRALDIHERLGDQRMQAVTRKSLGEAYARKCNFEIAMDHYDRTIELYKALGDRSGEADLLNKVGSVEFNRGNYQAAIDKFLIALPMHQELGNRSMEGEDRNDMGISHTYLNQPELALPLLKEAIEIHGELGNRRLEAIAISNLAGTYCGLRQQQEPETYETALLEARKAGAVARDVEDKLTEV